MKKIISLLLVVVLTATITIGGTLAYLTMNAGDENNVFTVGNINVSLKEEVGVVGEGGEVKKTEDGAEYIEVMPGDYLKKEVTVSNNGKTDAYVAVTVDVNNFKEIQRVIEAYGEDDAVAEAMLDNVFNGWGMTVQDRYVDGVKDMSYKVNELVEEHILHVDSAKRIYASDVAHFSILNWFKSDAEKAATGYTVPGVAKSYYAPDMADYSLRFTYYIYLPAGESATLFNGLNVPAEFTADQMKMFEGLQINVEASAIQADNMAVAAQYKNDPDGEAKTAFAILAGKIEVPDDYTNAPVAVDTWDGNSDLSWYNDTDIEFTLTTAEQLAGLADLVDGGNTFEGKTLKLGQDIDLYAEDANGERISFDPIGYGYNTVFKGTFDGQGHAISNLYQNGWALGLSYGTQGGGLFASVVDATFKNLTLDKSEIVMECVDMGTLVGYSYGNCTYENILVSNSVVANYNRYTGGVVGEVNGTQTFKNVDVDAGTTVSALWGTYDAALGGIIGGKYGTAVITMEDCDVACRIDAFNDACSNYMYYNYRLSGMLIGMTEESTAGAATASYLTATNCTVTYGDWADYTYCEFVSNGQGSYNAPDEYKHSRVQEGYATEGVDPSHTHTDVESHEVLLEFDQIFGGDKGVSGGKTHDGVTVIYNNK